VPVLQTWLVDAQSPGARQSPVTQAPAWQMWFDPYWLVQSLSLPQLEQTWPVQILPPLQLAWVRQSPVMQAPLRQS
jgi:hypothetical protein